MQQYLRQDNKLQSIIPRCAIVWLVCFLFPSIACLGQSKSHETHEARTLSKSGSIISSETDAWCAPAASLPFPNKVVYGRIFNHPFTVDRTFITYDTVFGIKGSKPKRSLVLTLRQGSMHPDKMSYAPRIAFDITFFCGDLASLAGKTIVVSPVRPIDPTKNYPMVTVTTNVVAKQDSPTYTTDMHWPRSHNTYMAAGSNYGYGMRLTFAKMQGDRLPGYIVLRVADKDHSFVEGYFYATVKDAWPGFDNLQAHGEFPSEN